MRRIPPISSWMTAFPRHLEPTVTVGEARRFMQDHGIHHVPVTGSGSELAVVHLNRLPDDDAIALHEVAFPATVVDAAERADHVVQHMADNHVSVVIVMHHRHLAGIFTWTDACRHCAQLLREPFLPPEGGDVA